jgi:hypothetical protein
MVVSERTLEGMLHRRPENLLSIWMERYQQYATIMPKMRAMTGRYHLNSRLKVAFMDRLFFVNCAYTEPLISRNACRLSSTTTMMEQWHIKTLEQR